MGVAEDHYPEPKLVADSFGRVAKEYDKYAVVQSAVLQRLLERLDPIKLECATIVDLGSGTGAASKSLKKRFKKAKVINVDLSIGMLKHSKRRGLMCSYRVAYANADAHFMPFVDDSVELVFTNLMLQWCRGIDQVFGEIKRVLKPGGLLVFSTFGPDTLKEIKQSWQKVDAGVHVNAFYDMHDLGGMVAQAGLSDMVLDTDLLTVYYQDVKSFMKELKKIGACNRLGVRRKTLTGKKRMLNMIEAYEEYRDDQGLPVSYEVVYGHAWNLARAANVAGEVEIPLRDLTSKLHKSAIK